MRARIHIVSLSDEQQQRLHRLTHSGTASARSINRARILLKSAAGETDGQIAEALDLGIATVERTRRQFATEGLDAALEPKPQPPRPDKIKVKGDVEHGSEGSMAKGKRS